MSLVQCQCSHLMLNSKQLTVSFSQKVTMGLRCQRRIRISLPYAHAGPIAYRSWIWVTPAQPLVRTQARPRRIVARQS
jgi:hypothetical protein